MHRLSVLVLVCAAVLSSAETEPEVKAEESNLWGRHQDREPIRQDRTRHQDDRMYSRVAEHGHEHEESQRIVDEVYSPDYAEPTLILDYRYMKSGGRDYVRGPGGQIIILPKGRRNDEPKEFPDYDSLIEHLRVKNQGKTYRQEDVALNNERVGHRPRYNQHEHDYQHGPYRPDYYHEFPAHH
ncbi:hypothetical protein evm_002818 [Chilo suppressalis]|nr:hypothetical protein evm_002818 [Chilo suppressalis]